MDPTVEAIGHPNSDVVGCSDRVNPSCHGRTLFFGTSLFRTCRKTDNTRGIGRCLAFDAVGLGFGGGGGGADRVSTHDDDDDGRMTK